MDKPKDDRFRNLELSDAINLRWTLRDIRSKRWNLTPINPVHIEKLREMGLVEMREDGFPMLTNAA
jgi:DNA-binding transcriptional ArsR family regulator